MNDELIMKIRELLLSIHNKYIANKIYSDGTVAIDLTEYCYTDDVELSNKLSPFVTLAVELEGSMEAYENSSEVQYEEALKGILKKILEKMKEV